jgi:hypothetical protein
MKKASIKKRADSHPLNQKGIPIAEMLFSTRKKGKVILPQKSKEPAFREREVLKEDWNNHPLRKKYKVPASKVRVAAQSAIDAVWAYSKKRFQGTSSAQQLEDRAVIQFFKNESLPIQLRFAQLATELDKIEKRGHSLSPFQVILDKLHNFRGRSDPGKIYMSYLDQWLCRNWVKDLELCILGYTQISKIWVEHSKQNGLAGQIGADDIRSRVNRLKLKRLKVTASTKST